MHGSLFPSPPPITSKPVDTSFTLRIPCTYTNTHTHTHTHTQQADLAQLYLKAGLKNIGTVFLLTDAQVPDEKFLVLINDLLASGEIPDLFAGVCVCVCVCVCANTFLFVHVSTLLCLRTYTN